ncbi:MAG: Lsr2 family protein [Actinomycetota bacterium]|nr:Lsr2 family protein [Actinomycetota bacterium]
MAQKVVREFIDDIDGSAAERTFTFAVDGTTYEIDLSSENIAEFMSAIGGFIESARKVKTTSNGRRQRGASTTDLPKRRGRLNEVREWARKNGYNVSDRGRVSAEVLAAFENRGSATAAVE